MGPLAALLSRPLQIALLVAALLAFIYFKGKASGKEKSISENPLPNSGSGIPIDGYTPTGAPRSWDAKPLAHELYNVLSGLWTPAFEKEIVFNKLLVLTNDQLTAVYNAFNKLFYSKGNGTMVNWIEDEYNISMVTKQPELVARLRNLNLK